MEQRVSRLEAQYDHLRDDVKRVEGKVDQLEKKLDTKVGALQARMAALEAQLAVFMEKLNTSRMLDRVWQLLANAVILGVMARGFKWI